MRILFLGDVCCVDDGTFRSVPDSLKADCCVYNMEYVYDDGTLKDADAAEEKVNVCGTGMPFGLGYRRYVATLANNHSLDWTDNGVLSTIRMLERNEVPYVGLNDRDGTRNGWIKISSGVSLSSYLQKIRVTNVPEGMRYRQMIMERELVLSDALAAKKAGSTFHVVYLHWGTELMPKPWANQIDFAHDLVDSGLVDLVVGMHPHVRQPFEIYKGKYIFYSIGNTVFPTYRKPHRFKNGRPTIMGGPVWMSAAYESLSVLFDTDNNDVRVYGTRYDERSGSLKITEDIVESAKTSDMVVNRVDQMIVAWRGFMFAVGAFLYGDFKKGMSLLKLIRSAMRYPIGRHPSGTGNFADKISIIERPVTISFDDIRSLIARAHIQNEKSGLKYGVMHQTADMVARKVGSDGHCLVCISNGVLCGTVTLSYKCLPYWYAKGLKVGIIRSLAIDPEFKGRGIGDRLIKACCSLAREKTGIVVIDSAEENVGIRKLAMKNNFHRVDYCAYAGNNFYSVVYGKHLDKATFGLWTGWRYEVKRLMIRLRYRPHKIDRFRGSR